MDLRELNEHLERRRKLAKVEDMKAALESAAEPGAQTVTGMPHTSGYRDKLGELAAEIADVSTEIDGLRKQIATEEKTVTAFLDSIPDGFTRTVFRLRFLRGMSWRQIADTVDGGNTGESIRSVVRRYARNLTACDRP